MNVYDFDKTIFYPDSSHMFVRWYMRRHPKVTVRHFGKIAVRALGYFTGRVGLCSMKEQVFAFLSDAQDIDSEVIRFWDEYRGNLEPWYLAQKRDDDLIISASPRFLLEPVCRELGVRLIATEMDRQTGKITGENNNREEKLRRFNKEYPDGVIDEFYSDSLNDTPLARKAKRAFMVKKGKLSPWPEN